MSRPNNLVLPVVKMGLVIEVILTLFSEEMMYKKRHRSSLSNVSFISL